MSFEAIKAKQKTAMAHQRQWETRRYNQSSSTATHCVCLVPKLTADATSLLGGANWLRMVGTVQCANCGRAVFTADGQPVCSESQDQSNTMSTQPPITGG